MSDRILVYISAAPDLETEREVLGRAVTELPVTLGWRIVQSPTGREPVDWQAVAEAGVHLLLIGGDIRAPIGQEWLAARRSGRMPRLYRKDGILRTPAAESFIRFVGSEATWRGFTDLEGLRRDALLILARHILSRAGYYALAPAEREGLAAWREQLYGRGLEGVDPTARGAGQSGVVLSPERYEPSGGVLVRPLAERSVPQETDDGPGTDPLDLES